MTTEARGQPSLHTSDTSARAGVALVTGAGRGIGRGIALGLAAKGWAVVINYRGNESSAQEAARRVEAQGGQALVVQADVASAADREQLVAQTLETFGRIDLLVNNAGMAPRERRDILETTEASYDEVMGVNLKGPYFLTQRVARTMIEQVEANPADSQSAAVGAAQSQSAAVGAARSQSAGQRRPMIINIGSLSAYASSVNRGEYCISKAGMGMMTALFADRLAAYGILVYEIRPGIMETDMTSKVKDRYDKLIGEGLTPIQRWGQPEDVARAVMALVEGGFPFSTGEIINVDGGFHLHRL